MRRLATQIMLAGIVVGVLAACGGTKTLTVTQTVTRTVTKTTTAPATTTTGSGAATAPACSGADLGGSFAVVPGSAGAGSISYGLTLTNTSSAACYVSGIPQLQLLDAKGATVPTAVSAAQPGQGTAAKVVLDPGASAKADARFSPDVPGPGEDNPGACEPTAHQLRVTVGAGSVTVPVSPPTSVCSHGALRMSLLAAG
ncbi:MAG TPA: DUF4232 domain-containing protein [Gaiellaceae bacterium]|nr:DUF4232 domain-containing protein [Gaiellaceae bacterium]